MVLFQILELENKQCFAVTVQGTMGTLERQYIKFNFMYWLQPTTTNITSSENETEEELEEDLFLVNRENVYNLQGSHFIFLVFQSSLLWDLIKDFQENKGTTKSQVVTPTVI